MPTTNEKIARASALKDLAQQLKGKIPTSVSQLTNDSGYQTEAQVETAITGKGYQTEQQVAAAVAAADHLQRRKVVSKDAIDPDAEGADKFIYMVPKTGSDEDDLYDEYMVLDGAVEHVGNTKVDLSGYVPKETGKGLSSNDYTDEDKAKLDGIEIATDAEIAAMLEEVFGA